MSNKIGQTYHKTKKSDFDGPAKVTLLAMDASNSRFTVTNADSFESPISLTPQQFSEHYGGDADFPTSEREAILAQSVRQNEEAIRGHSWQEGLDGGGRASSARTPEEQLSDAAT